ncbi:hypothetical protein DOY81_003950, partial [Sarcophaga bullata]
MLADIVAASVLEKAISTSATSICLYTCSVNPSVCKENLYRNIIACAMQHSHCKQQTLKKSQLYCQKRMCFGRWHQCCAKINIYTASGNNILQKQMCMLFGNQLGQTTFKNILIKRLKRLNNRNNNKNNNHKGSSGRGGLSMKLYLTSSSMLNNNMMC